MKRSLTSTVLALAFAGCLGSPELEEAESASFPDGCVSASGADARTADTCPDPSFDTGVWDAESSVEHATIDPMAGS